MGKRKHANISCPCGSGKKYKKCCIDKEDDPEFSNPFNFLKSFKAVRKEAKIKQCLFPNHAECSENIIGAHSIQNNKILKNISNNGIVYMPCPKSDNPFAAMTKWGRKEATVFTGFCGNHDNEVFKPIENNSFDKSDLHVFLYTYRCFAVEYHKKQEAINMRKSIFKRKPSLINMPKDDDPFNGLSLAIDDFQHVKDVFDTSLLTDNYNILTSIIWEFPYAVNFAASGFEAPTKDLLGDTIQNCLDVSIVAKHIFMIVFPEDEKTYCIISWLKSNDRLFSKLHEQLDLLDIDKRKIYINNILPIISENIAINPTAWDELEQHKKDEFGVLFWNAATLGELSGTPCDRLSPPSFDLFAL